MNFIKKRYELFIFLVLSIVLNLGILTRDGTIAFRHDWNLPSNAVGLRGMFQSAFFYFSDDQFGYAPFYPTDILYRIVIGSFGYIGLSGEFISKGIIILSLFLSGYFMYRFVRYLKNGTYGPFLAGLFYMLTPVMYNKIIAGHIYYMLSYALVPLFMMTLLLSFRHTEWNKRISHLLVSMLLFVIIGAQIQFFVMVALIVAIYFFGVPFSEKIKLFRNFFFVGLFSIICNLPWIIFIFDSEKFQQVSASAATYDWFKTQSVSILEALSLTGYVSDYFVIRYDNIILLSVCTILFSLLLLPAIGMSVKEKYVKTNIAVLAIGIFIVSGMNSFFEPLFKWAFHNISLVSMFRELYHVMFIPAFGIAVLFGITYDHFLFFIKPIRIKLAFTVVLIGGMTLPFLMNGLEKDTSSVVYGKEYSELQKSELKNTESRIVWYPFFQPMNKGEGYAGYDSLSNHTAKPTLTQNGGMQNYAHYIGYNLYHQLTYNKATPYLGRLLSIYNIDSFLYRKEFQSQFEDFYSGMSEYPNIRKYWQNESIYDIMKNQQDLEMTEDNKEFTLFKNQHATSIFQPIMNPILSTGGLNSMNDVMTMPKGLHTYDGVKIASLQTEEYPEIDSILLHEGKWKEYLLRQNSNVDFLDLSIYARESLNSKESWVQTYNRWWYHPTFVNTIDNGIFTVKEQAHLKATMNVSKTGGYVVLAKVLNGVESGEIEFMINGEKQILSTQSLTKNDTSWMELGYYVFLDGEQNVEITNINGENAIFQMAFVPEKDYKKLEDSEVMDFVNKDIMIVHNSYSNWIREKKKILFEEHRMQYVKDEKYEVEERNGRIRVSALFEQERDGYVDITIPTDFNIKDLQVMELNYIIDNPKIQTVQIGFDIEYGVGKTTTIWGNPFIYNDNQVMGRNQFITNVYDVVSRQLGVGAGTRVTAVHIVPHKMWGLTEEEMKDGTYNFEILDISFYSNAGLVSSMPTVLPEITEETNGYEINVPVEGTYMLYGQFPVKEEVLLGVYIDKELQQTLKQTPTDGWLALGQYELSEGKHVIHFLNQYRTTHSHKLVLLKEKEEGKPFATPKPNEEPTIDIKQLSTTHYEIKTNSKEDFMASFNYNFDPSWKIKGIDGSEHFYINGYANGFVIPKGIQTFEIIYEPQTKYASALVVSLFIVLITTIGALVLRKRNITLWLKVKVIGKLKEKHQTKKNDKEE